MASKSISYCITEEIVRFAFEVHVKSKAKGWNIGFTNPTAGPWKKIVFIINNKPIEVGRYEREEERPDLILYNYELGVCLILEAKDRFEAIFNQGQLIKSIRVFLKEEARILKNVTLKSEWPELEKVKFIYGFLWYDVDFGNADKVSQVCFEHLKNKTPIMCIIVSKQKEDLICGGKLFIGKAELDNKLEDSLKSLHLEKL